MFKEKVIIQICVALCVLLLPVAHVKVVVFGLPIYSVEMPIIVALMAYLYEWRKGTFSPVKNLHFRDPLVIGVGLFFCGAILSFVVNPFNLTGLGMLKTWFVLPLALLFIWKESEPKIRDIEKILLVWFGVIAVVVLLSLEYFFQGGLTFDGRLSAWFASPNYLAFFLAPGILLAQYFFAHPIFEKKKWGRISISCIFLLLLFVLFHTRSYTTWLSIVFVSGTYFFLTLQREAFQKKGLVIVFLLFVFSVFLFSEVGSEKWQALVSIQERSSLSSRMMIWHVATRALFDHPFFGIGIGRFQEVYLSYQHDFPLYLEWAVPQPHNLYLAIWLQTGIIGLCGFGFFVVAWLRQMMALRRLSDEFSDTKKLSALLVSLLLLFLFFGIADTPFFKTDQAFIFWLIFFFGVSLVKKK